MKHIGMVVIGLLLVGALFGVAAASVTSDVPVAQRATSTPSPTAVLRVPVTLVARPLPILIPITATPVVTVTPIMTITPRVTPTIRTTPTVRTTPTPRNTPTGAPAAADAPDGIVAFSASASRLRGQIELRWGYVGAPFTGNFIVERSTNGGAWRYAASCTQPYIPNEDTYRCRDTGLTSGASYQYRICITDEAYGSCATAASAETDAIKAP